MGSQEGLVERGVCGRCWVRVCSEPNRLWHIWSLGIVEQKHLCWIPPSLGRPEGTWGGGRLEEDDSFVTGKGLVLIHASLDSHLSLPSSA